MLASEQSKGAPGNLLGIFCVVGAGVTFTTNDMAIKWLSGDYPLHQIILARSPEQRARVQGVVPVVVKIPPPPPRLLSP